MSRPGRQSPRADATNGGARESSRPARGKGRRLDALNGAQGTQTPPAPNGVPSPTSTLVKAPARRRTGRVASGLPVTAGASVPAGPPERGRGNGVAPRRAPARAAKPAAAKPAAAKPAAGHQPDGWDRRVAGALAFLRRRLTGEYDVDEFGFDPELTAATVHPLLRLPYRHYFRVEVSGVENLPPEGSALIVANHSGTIPVDALMLMMAVHDETPGHRHLRLLGADLVFRIPILSELARKFGSTLACNADAERMLRAGEYVGVFPEGFKGIGKPYRDRYRLQRFGRGGFVSAALRTGTPIIPAAIVGAEEIYPKLGDIKPLARMTGLPYVPVTPLFPWLGPLGLIPLPSKWLIEFGAPIQTAAYGEDAEDPIVVFNLADEVRETIQQTLHALLQRRPDPFG